LVVATGLPAAQMYELVRVGELGLVGEIIEMRGSEASIQVYEETQGLAPGQPVEPTGQPLSVELGPGLLASVYDGMQRPLAALRDAAGAFLSRGLSSPGLSREALWDFKPSVGVGAWVNAGSIIGTVREHEVFEHRIMVPPGLSGTIASITGGWHHVDDVVATLQSRDGSVHELTLLQRWPVRTARPYRERKLATEPLITGTRVIDSFFPLLKGGVACIPGPFGAGKTVTQHQIAKWANAQVVIFIGCGERGNEMTDVLREFPELTDPATGRPLLQRTVLIANTSNMPVAAREASVYTGITIAEYFRDMGYEVVLQADSTSRWAEAMREISGRLEEMPGEEGYPAYLGSRLAAFYERAGVVQCLSTEYPDPSTREAAARAAALKTPGADAYCDCRTGSVSVVGSVSPPGGDLSEPVVQNTLRVVKVFWALQDTLAFQRHFPAIDWIGSYSLYLDRLEPWWAEHVAGDYRQLRDRAAGILAREQELTEIVRLVGMDALSPAEQASMDCARMIREDFLQQNAFRDDDQFSSLTKQACLLRLILDFHDRILAALDAGAELADFDGLAVRDALARAKYLADDDSTAFSDLAAAIAAAVPLNETDGAHTPPIDARTETAQVGEGV
jgi:V/A-type H+-transporting ATPase subunit A